MPMSLTPEQRSHRARIAAHTLHGSRDPLKHTEPARKAFLEGFEHRADPEGILPPDERKRRAAHLMKAHMYRLSLASSRARAKGGDAA